MADISSLQGIRLPGGYELPAQKPSQGGFQKLLQQAIHQVESARADAEQSANAFIQGDDKDVHSVALSVQRAELQLELALQVRNKVVQAYQEIMRMQI